MHGGYKYTLFTYELFLGIMMWSQLWWLHFFFVLLFPCVCLPLQTSGRCWIVLLFNAMGCIQSIRCKPKSFRDSIIVLEVNTSIDSNPTSIDESSSVVLRYRTPHFRACARILVPPVPGKETWTIGWIQACNHMEFYNKYGNKGMWVFAAFMWLALKEITCPAKQTHLLSM